MAEESTPKRRTNVGAKVHPQKRKAWEDKFKGRIDAIDAAWNAIYADVRKAYEDGLPLNEIARMLGVEQSTASGYKRAAEEGHNSPTMARRGRGRAVSGKRNQRGGPGSRGGAATE